MDYLNLDLMILILIFTLLLFELVKINKNLSFIMILLLYLFYNFFLSREIWNLLFISLDSWKLSVLVLILGSFIIIFQLLKSKELEIIILNLMVLFGSLFLVMSDNLIVIYLLIELQTFSLFILISKNKSSIKSSEAGLKYFILGAISSGLFLLGVSFLFSTNISMNIKELMIYSNFNHYVTKIGVILIILSLFFKLAIFPLHFWIADIYEGSSWEVISLISTIPKISVIFILSQFTIFSNFFMMCSILSIIIGTLGALNQTKIKRLLAYSGISHIGFILLGLSLLSKGGYEISFIYLLIYVLTILGVFILINFSNFNPNDYLIDLSNINLNNKLIAFSWLILFLSIAGIPPLSGFISKWLILNLLVDSNFLFPVIIGILFSAIGAGYYLRVIKISYFQKQGSYVLWKNIISPNYNRNSTLSLILGIIIYFSLFLILQPNFLILLSHLNCFYFI